MTRNLNHGLDHITHLTRKQGERFLQCRREGKECAWRFYKNEKGKRTNRPVICGHIAAGTRCEK